MLKNRSKRRSGQSLVEAAFVLSFVLLPLTMGFIQFAIISNSATTVQEISREAGRFAAVHGLESTFDSGTTQGDSAGETPSLRYYISVVCSPTAIKYADLTNSSKGGYITVTPSTVANRTPGDPISVSICYPMVNKMFLGNLLPGTSAMAQLKKPYAVTSTFVLE